MQLRQDFGKMTNDAHQSGAKERFMAERITYDAVVVGSGQGGMPLAAALGAKGLHTAIIEMSEVGGSCINYGCTPTKTMVASARIAHQVARAEEYGVVATSGNRVVNLARIRERKRTIVDSFRSGSERRIENAENLTLVRGTASFVDSHSLSVADAAGNEVAAITAQRIFLNTGTRAAVPDIEGLSAIDYLTNETVMELDELPEHLVIVGGGYIGVEFGQMFRRFGAKVTIIQHGPALLGREDDDVSAEIAGILRDEGISLLFESHPVAISGGGQLTISVRTPTGAKKITGSHLLLAAGRTPNSDRLNLPAAGIEPDPRGYIEVNEKLETTVESVWALGDIKGGPAFTHISYDDFRIIMRNLYGDGKGTTRDRMLPYTVFTDPQIGRIGLGEEEARAAGRKIRVAKMPMSWVARALEVDETRGFMKAIVDNETDRILGFSMVGIEAGEIAGAVQIAMMGGLPFTALRDGTFSHPTLLESLNNLFGALQ